MGRPGPCQTRNGSGVRRAQVCSSELDNPTRKEPQRRLEGLLQLPKQQAPSLSPTDPLPAPEPLSVPRDGVCPGQADLSGQ